jgi:glutaminyl-tRNA synthetase
MRQGEFPDGARVLRAKIDMASGNMNMRDPVMYRILHATHHRTGDAWCIYPMYDFAHGQSDSIENITHSLCDLAYEDHRPLYEWFLNELDIFRTRQIEFARLNVTYTILSKRFLKQLVDTGRVVGWDDPRMPTLCGMRRRGFTAAAVRNFIDKIGVSKKDNLVDVSLLEFSVREDLNRHASRVMGVLDPIKVIITNYPEAQVEYFDALNNPEEPLAGTRKVPFTREIFIDRDDFREVAPPKYFRLSPGAEVRLRYGYIIKCEQVIKHPETGEIQALLCTYDPGTAGADRTSDRKVKGIIHWVSAAYALDAEVRMYDRLFTVPNPGKADDGKTFLDYLNPNSLDVLKSCKVEPVLVESKPGAHYQFERKGFFCVDLDSTPDHLVFNLTLPLRDAWAKIDAAQKSE